ncbi:hypothetical protein STEG23_017353 [Scotinomys teguina]
MEEAGTQAFGMKWVPAPMTSREKQAVKETIGAQWALATAKIRAKDEASAPEDLDEIGTSWLPVSAILPALSGTMTSPPTSLVSPWTRSYQQESINRCDPSILEENRNPVSLMTTVQERSPRQLDLPRMILPKECASFLPGVFEMQEAVILIHIESQDGNKALALKFAKDSFHLCTSLGISECFNIYL